MVPSPTPKARQTSSSTSALPSNSPVFWAVAAVAAVVVVAAVAAAVRGQCRHCHPHHRPRGHRHGPLRARLHDRLHGRRRRRPLLSRHRHYARTRRIPASLSVIHASLCVCMHSQTVSPCSRCIFMHKVSAQLVHAVSAYRQHTHACMHACKDGCVQRGLAV